MTWPDLEPGKGQWHFENLDRSLALAEAHHAGVLLTLGLTPRWASARPQEPSGYAPGFAAEPKDIEDWRVFVRTVATRYKGRIHAYEIWNEPNVKKFWTGNIDQLAALTREASIIIHGIDPQAIVVSPPATGFPGIKWLPEFLGKAGQYVDVIGYHFYLTPRPPEATLQLVDAIKKVMTENGAQDKPLWDTEAGWLPPAQIDPDWGRLPARDRTSFFGADGVQRFYWYAWDSHTSVALQTTEKDNQTLTGGPGIRHDSELVDWRSHGLVQDGRRPDMAVPAESRRHAAMDCLESRWDAAVHSTKVVECKKCHAVDWRNPPLFRIHA